MRILGNLIMPFVHPDVSVDLILPGLRARDRDQVLWDFTKPLASQIFYPHEKLFTLLMEKERQAGSGIGNGVAIPHLQLEFLQKPIIALATLDQPVDFDAFDDAAVDIVCILLSSLRDGTLHLRRLSRLTRLFKNADFRDKIREAEDAETARAIFIAPDGWMLAA